MVSITPMTTELAHKLFSGFEQDKALFANEKDFVPYVYVKENVDKYVESRRKKGNVLLAILINEEVIGEIRFKDFDMDRRSAELGIVLKCDRFKNRGLGTEAIRLAIDYAGNGLGLLTVTASVLKTNKRSLRVCEKTGFRYDREDDQFIYLEKETK